MPATAVDVPVVVVSALAGACERLLREASALVDAKLMQTTAHKARRDMRCGVRWRTMLLETDAPDQGQISTNLSLSPQTSLVLELVCKRHLR